ncbi:acyl carrier protein [Ideonella sp.]|uniref:acyl carrier protein n=1 Tax=Ideonella sp. TaxID=1929293 RepID=UPI002B485482|nr:acyl carrier protein [Ideonella sp.]HJV70171.1 acyl carrier protein [Ideonella sp.]HSN33302.1 acyl carrier protein [Ideonella sp.]
MNDRESVRQAVIEAVLAIAPEADFATVDPARSLRAQLDLDSFDFLNLLIALHERLGVEVPEADYGRVDSLDALVVYLADKRGRS